MPKKYRNYRNFCKDYPIKETERGFGFLKYRGILALQHCYYPTRVSAGKGRKNAFKYYQGLV
jgi:hypothetical protein